MASKTQSEINAEIARLKEIKPKVQHFSHFGDDNHAAIDAQLDALEGDQDDDEIYQLQDSGDLTDAEVESALGAIQWRDGEEDEAPSAGWEPLIAE